MHFAIQRDACVAAFAHVFPPELYPFPDAAVRERWREFRGTMLLAERDGRPVGLAAFEGCWLGGLYVVPDEWGSGVAGALHDAALAAMPDCPEVAAVDARGEPPRTPLLRAARLARERRDARRAVPAEPAGRRVLAGPREP